MKAPSVPWGPPSPHPVRRCSRGQSANMIHFKSPGGAMVVCSSCQLGVWCRSCFLDTDWRQILVSRDSPIGPDCPAKQRRRIRRRHRKLPGVDKRYTKRRKRANLAFTIVCCLSNPTNSFSHFIYGNFLETNTNISSDQGTPYTLHCME